MVVVSSSKSTLVGDASAKSKGYSCDHYVFKLGWMLRHPSEKRSHLRILAFDAKLFARPVEVSLKANLWQICIMGGRSRNSPCYVRGGGGSRFSPFSTALRVNIWGQNIHPKRGELRAPTVALCTLFIGPRARQFKIWSAKQLFLIDRSINPSIHPLNKQSTKQATAVNGCGHRPLHT